MWSWTKFFAGVMMVFGGIFVGIYVGAAYLLFIKGFIQMLHAIQATPINAEGVAWGCLKVLTSALVGVLVGSIIVWIGAAIVKSA